MAAYTQILRHFSHHGLTEQTLITENQVALALDSISKAATAQPFDPDVQHELWNETLDTLQGQQVQLSHYIDTIIRAEVTLRQRVEALQEQLKVEAHGPKRDDLLADLNSCLRDHQIISYPFGMDPIVETPFTRESKKFDVLRGNSQMFGLEVDEREQSTDLKVVFLICLLLGGFQLFAMFNKQHFFTLLGLLLLVSSFVLGYFEKRYVRVMLAWFVAAIIMDILWLVLSADVYWFSGEGTAFSSLQALYLKLVLCFVGVQILLKVVLVGLLFKYRDIGEGIKKKVSFGDLVLHLDAKPDHNNLIARAVAQPGASSPFPNDDN